jgi:hypothetical protein
MVTYESIFELEKKANQNKNIESKNERKGISYLKKEKEMQ